MDVDRGRLNIGAVLLAAGSSRRFGAANKLLMPVAGEPIIRRVAKAVAESRVAEVVVVTGPDREAITAALADLPLRFAANAAHLDGIGRSIATGVAALPDGVDGALILPGDMPRVSAQLINAIIDAFAIDGLVTYPVTRSGRQGNPVLWPRARFADLLALSGDHGAKSLLSTTATRAVTIMDEQALHDIDTPDDLDVLGDI